MNPFQTASERTLMTGDRHDAPRPTADTEAQRRPRQGRRLSRRPRPQRAVARLAALALLPALALVTALGLPLAAASPAAASPALNIDCGPGSLTITAAGANGPTAAVYGAPCTGSQVGQAQMTGNIQVTGPGNCGGGFGFAATHTDTITSDNGDTLTISITESSCLKANTTNVFECSGTYTVVAATGRLAGLNGTKGKWMGEITFAGFSAGSTGTFHSTYSS